MAHRPQGGTLTNLGREPRRVCLTLNTLHCPQVRVQRRLTRVPRIEIVQRVHARHRGETVTGMQGEERTRGTLRGGYEASDLTSLE